MLKKLFILSLLLISSSVYAACVNSKGTAISFDNDMKNTFIDTEINYKISLNLIGNALSGQKVYYEVKDESGAQVVSKTRVSGNNTTITWQAKIDDIVHYQGVIPNKEYIVVVYGLKTPYVDANGATKYLGTAFPFHIQQQADSITTTYSNENDSHSMGQCRDYVTFHGSLGIKVSTASQADIMVDMSDQPSTNWTFANTSMDQKELFDKEFSLYYDSKAYSITHPTIINPAYPWKTVVDNSINMNISVPYVSKAFISPHNMPEPLEYSKGYKFKS